MLNYFSQNTHTHTHTHISLLRVLVHIYTILSSILQVLTNWKPRFPRRQIKWHCYINWAFQTKFEIKKLKWLRYSRTFRFRHYICSILIKKFMSGQSSIPHIDDYSGNVLDRKLGVPYVVFNKCRHYVDLRMSHTSKTYLGKAWSFSSSSSTSCLSLRNVMKDN